MDDLPYIPPPAPGRTTADDLFACETGVALWEAYRVAYPDGETNPDADPLLVTATPPELLAFWDHQAQCGDCLEAD